MENSENRLHTVMIANTMEELTDMVSRNDKLLSFYCEKHEGYKYELKPRFKDLKLEIKFWKEDADTTEGSN